MRSPRPPTIHSVGSMSVLPTFQKDDCTSSCLRWPEKRCRRIKHLNLIGRGMGRKTNLLFEELGKFLGLIQFHLFLKRQRRFLASPDPKAKCYSIVRQWYEANLQSDTAKCSLPHPPDQGLSCNCPRTAWPEVASRPDGPHCFGRPAKNRLTSSSLPQGCLPNSSITSKRLSHNSACPASCRSSSPPTCWYCNPCRAGPSACSTGARTLSRSRCSFLLPMDGCATVDNPRWCMASEQAVE